MIINKIEHKVEGVRQFDSILDNFKDLISMFSKTSADMGVELKKQKLENDKIGHISLVITEAIKKLIKDDTITNISIYIKDDDLKTATELMETYKDIVKTKLIKTNSVKNGYNLIIYKRE